MSVRVDDTRVVISQADDNTGGTWTGTGGGFGTAVYVEAPNAWIGTLQIATGQYYITLTTPQTIANQMIYVWSNNYALNPSWTASNPANAMHLGDGTNNISFMMAGAEKKVFSHLENQDWGWDCLLLDVSQAPILNANGYTVTRAGSFANWSASTGSAAMTIFGSDFTTLSKGLGGGTNVAVDIIRMGNHGLRITSGSSSDPGKFLQIVAEDRSTANLKAHGIIRQYTTGIYGLQGPLTFGTASAAGSYFSDSGVTLAFEARDVANDKYYLKVTGSATATTTFILDNSTVTTAGPYVALDFSGSSATQIRTLTVTNNSFSGLGNPIYFANNYSSSFHTVQGNTFSRCGIIEAGNTLFSGNSINNSTNKSGSLLLNSASKGNTYSDLSFNKTDGTAGHAIYITSPASYSFNNFTYDGFGADASTTASVYNNSGGYVHITITGGGDNPTVRNGTSATTEISNPKTLKLTGMVSGTEVTITSGSDSTVLFHVEDVDTAGSASYQYNYTPNTIVDILIFHVDYDPQLSSIFNYTLLADDATIPVQQIPDRNYYNPPGP